MALPKPPAKPLDAAALSRRCDPADFDFATTAELPDFVEFVGQDRAVEAMRFGLGIKQEGYNVFVLGPQGTGRHTFTREHITRRAAEQPAAKDWCYVNNFDDPQRPRALSLPPGRGRGFRSDLEKLIREAFAALPAAFESDDYRNRRQAIEDTFREEQNTLFSKVQDEAKARGIALMQTPTGVAFAPIVAGEVVSAEAFQKLPDDEQKRIQADIDALGHDLQNAMRTLPKHARQARQRIDELNREIASFAAGSLVDDLKRDYADLPDIVTYLDQMLEDIIDNAELFLRAPDEPQHKQTSRDGGSGHPTHGPVEESPAIRRYGINLLVECGACDGAPVVFEDHPTYQNLIGEVEHIAQMGALLTDFHLIKPGALHKANGGYLVLNARKLLSQPYAWEGLKRALRGRHLKIEALSDVFGFASTVSLEPEPVPLDVKVVLIGDYMGYYLLQQYDPEFFDLFKVTVELDEQMQRSAENESRMARLLATFARQQDLKPLDPAAVARVIDEGARQADDADRVTTRIRLLADLVREADYWAGDAKRDVITRDDIVKAIEQRIHRVSRIRERVQEEILRETILIDTAGARVGQINGLSVLRIGELTFGRPSRITARLHMGAGRVIDIEREVQLGGPLHSKGVLILSSYLAAHYASDRPLSLSASLVFEQSYGGVDGDSASCAELFALLSALSDVPIKQSFAVTGSVNQYGEVQAIGGVNEKIEGFFDICNARGLTGEQGIVIPAANIKHLMLRQNVVDAAAQGQFHIYPVTTIDEGLEILTGMEAGARRDDGTFPDGSVNERARLKLIEYAERRREFAQGLTTERERRDGGELPIGSRS